MRKLTLLLAAGAGYVLGARAGRERYDQIKRTATRVKDDPRVQEKAHQAADLAKDKAAAAAPVVKDTVTSAASAAADKMPSRGSSSSTSTPSSTTSSTSSSTSDLESQLHPDNVALQDDPYPQGDLP